MTRAASDLLQLFQHSGDGAWAVDGEQRIVMWNETATELLGYPAAEALGKFCHELLAGKDLGGRPVCGPRCAIGEQARQGRPVRAFNLRVRCRSGNSVWIDVSAIAVPGEEAATGYRALVHLFRFIGRDGDTVPPLRIRLLGNVLVQRADGSPVAGRYWRRAKVRALLALLALDRNRGVSRDELLLTLWPELAREAALHNLNTTVYYLRHALEPALEHGPDSTYLRQREDRYLLAGGRAHWLDVDAFEQALAVARHGGGAGRSEHLFRQAITLYRGDFLADLDAYRLDCWTERERYHQLYLDALQELGDMLMAQGREDEAMALYREVVAGDPCPEAAARRLARPDAG